MMKAVCASIALMAVTPPQRFFQALGSVVLIMLGIKACDLASEMQIPAWPTSRKTYV